MCSLSNFEMFNSVVLTIVNKIVGKFSFVLNVWEMKWLDRVAQTVKRLSTMQETWVRSLGREDLLEKEMAIHSSTIAWKIPRTEEPGRLQSMGSQRVGHDWATSLTHIWNLEKWNRWTYVQGRNRDTGVENGFMDPRRERGGGMNWEVGLTYIPYHM